MEKKMEKLEYVEKGENIELHINGEVHKGVVTDYFEVPRVYGHNMVLELDGDRQFLVIERPKNEDGYLHEKYHAEYRVVKS